MKNQSSKLNPWYVTGLTDSDGSFGVGIYKSASRKIGWKIVFLFTLVASNNAANRIMFEQIQQYFNGIGLVSVQASDNTVRYTVNTFNGCLAIRDHFLSYPLFTYKLVYFTLWCQIMDLVISKAHLTWVGLLQIIALKALFKRGLSDLLRTSFPGFTPVKTPDYAPNLSLMNFHWLAGFVNGDGSFSLLVIINARKTEQYAAVISITQDIISKIVLDEIVKLIGCGKVYAQKKETFAVRLTSIVNINKYIELMKETQLLGAKALDYADFCKGIDIVNKGEHLTAEGFAAYKALSAGMSSKRTNFDSV